MTLTEWAKCKRRCPLLCQSYGERSLQWMLLLPYSIAGFRGQKPDIALSMPMFPLLYGLYHMSQELPVTEPASNLQALETMVSSASSASSASDDYYPDSQDKSSHLIEQAELNDVRLSKQEAETPGPMLQQRSFCHKISTFRNRKKSSEFYEIRNSLWACKDIIRLMQELGFEHYPGAWRVFADSSKVSFWAVLLHSGNEWPSMPLVHEDEMKGTHDKHKNLTGCKKI